MINGLILAFEFFSRLPFKKNIDFTRENISYSVFFMPFVGLTIGFISAIFFNIIAQFDRLMASFFTVAIMMILTGGLHIDGLSDTFDGFLSNRNKEKTLEIMKDSRIGTFGTIAIIFVVLGKILLIYRITKNINTAIIFSMASSRLATSINIAHKKCAKNDGLGFLFYNSKPLNKVIISSVLYVLFISIENIYNIIPLVVTIMFSLAFAKWADIKIGGITGDINGATIELGEMISLLVYWGIEQWILF